jgi:hypothetical protein
MTGWRPYSVGLRQRLLEQADSILDRAKRGDMTALAQVDLLRGVLTAHQLARLDSEVKHALSNFDEENQ